ncbi:hypothetical protein DFH07DRAFT_62728 [Mycena maculata]|uniref:F-box domain-containing protein n=1 Tax=Mycena maculata TaxID=230809 RepID=A0AAD7IF96_9AGAR|nr:hypothetical protein DFH07DRAFT_62728 [Mycena maculata]
MANASESIPRDALRANLNQLDALLCDVGPSEDRRALARKRASMQSQLNAIVYPVLTLPPEVVSEIFLHCLCDPRARPNVAEAPLLLCNVCSQWRTIAILTPGLWSRLELTFKFSLFGTCFIDLLALWFSRTGSHPLSLSIFYDEYTATNRREGIIQLVKVLMRHDHQWEDVELKLPDVSEFHQFRGKFPGLKRLAVAPHSAKPLTPAVTAFTRAPQLTNAQLSAGCTLKPIVLPWTQLSVLKCESLHVPDCLSLLRETTQITELTVYFKPAHRLIPLSPPLLLPTLRFLHLLREECHMDLLQHLTLPALETLSISFTNPDIPRFLAFLSRSDCPLQRIIFDAWPFEQRELVKCLVALPSLRELKLWRPQYFTDSFLCQLADPAALLPNLQTLELDHVYPIQFTMPALVGMLAVRWSAPVRLETFRTVLHKASTVIDPESVFRMQALVALGMKLHIEYH